MPILLCWLFCIALLTPWVAGQLVRGTDADSGFVATEALLAMLCGVALLLAIMTITKGITRQAFREQLTVYPRWRWKLCLASFFITFTILLTSEVVLRLYFGVATTAVSLRIGVGECVLLAAMPVQVLLEEVLFRSWLPRQLLSFTRRGRLSLAIAFTISATIFALLHDVDSPAGRFSLYVSGIVACVLVLLTGGLEAAVGLHIGNNAVYVLSSAVTPGVAYTAQAATTSVLAVTCLSVLSAAATAVYARGNYR